MAFFVRRRDGRYELRESVHTERGPRARTLANFAVLTDAILARADGRAVRRLDPTALWNEALRKGVPVGPAGQNPAGPPPEYRRFVETSRRLGAELDSGGGLGQDPGQALVDLAELVDAIGAPERRPSVLSFPVLARLRR